MDAATLEQAIVILAPIAQKIIQQFQHRNDEVTEAEIIAAFDQHLADARKTGQDEIELLKAEDAAHPEG
jgi:hypothetical protein